MSGSINKAIYKGKKRNTDETLLNKIIFSKTNTKVYEFMYYKLRKFNIEVFCSFPISFLVLKTN